MTNKYNPIQHTAFANKVGSMAISKGKLIDHNDPDFEVVMYSWDAIQECMDEDCPADKYCDYQRTGKCTAMQKFLKACSSSLMFRSDTELDQDAVFRIGTELVPLYGQLMRFWIEELGVRSDVVYASRGKKNVHPIFKEIRETIKLIGITRQKIGVSGGDSDALKPGTVLPGGTTLKRSRKPKGSYQ